MKSNINIASNIYIRSREHVADDRAFVSAVQGHIALRLLRDDYLYGLPTNMQLSELQNQELTLGASCALAENGELTHGKIYSDGKLAWVGRCEYVECSKFSVCPAAWKIERAGTDSAVAVNQYTEFKFLGEDIVTDREDEFEAENTGIILDNIGASDVASMPCRADIDDKTLPLTENAEFYSRFEHLTDPQAIIQAPIESRILVNAGPGTGKTYSVIQRLLYLLSNNLIRPDKILMLCYSRAAVKVIRTRITEGVRKGELPIEANQLGVFTFDWFASKYLVELDADFRGLSYNERIELFNTSIREEYFSREFFEYLIVDELQDLVDVRAQMVLKLLGIMQCGYLLLGDRCQAIYDFDSELPSVDFYQKLKEVLPTTTLYYELLKNNRQTQELADTTAKIRTVLLRDTPVMQNTCLNNALKTLPVFANKLDQLTSAEFDRSKRTAILCRTNGDVLRICSLLCNAGIRHRILRGNMVNPKYKRFLADVFWDFVPIEMSREEFCRRYIARVKDDAQEAAQMFDELCSLIEAYGAVINMADLRRALLKEESTGRLTIDDDCNLIVSTIHRAKGQEFDTVYLLKYSAQNNATTAEEARISYVGMTRAKTILQKINIATVVFRKEKERYYRVTYRGKRFISDYYCSGIAVCYDEHIDRISFAGTNVHDNVWHIQQYIAEHVKQFDPVEAVYCEQDRMYHIMHDGVKIGNLSTGSADEFWKIIRCTSDRRNIPKKLTDLFVYDIYTVIEKAHNEHLSGIHKQSHIWLGLDIVGMGKANYNDYS